MPETITAAIQFSLTPDPEFDATLFDALLFSVGTPSLVATDDILSDPPIVCAYGIQGTSPADRIGSTGTLTFSLNNSESNSAHTLGYYSLLHPSKRAGFDPNMQIRFVLTHGATVAYKFYGRLGSVTPTTGAHDKRDVQCEARDWMDMAALLDLPDLDVQVGELGSTIVSRILDRLRGSDQPLLRDIETSLDTYPLALDQTTSGQRPKVREVLNQLALSGYEYGYIKGDLSSGGTFKWENRHHRVLQQSAQIDLTDAQTTSVVTSVSVDDVFSLIQIFVSPSSVDEFPTTVLYDLQTTETVVLAGATFDVLFGAYRDPLNSEPCGGIDLRTPIPYEDYTMNTLADGTGTDCTAFFTVTPTFTAIGVSWTLTNNGPSPAYVTRLRAVGKAIRRYSSVVEVMVDVDPAYGRRILSRQHAEVAVRASPVGEVPRESIVRLGGGRAAARAG
jgi:hypothetical protein